MKKFKISQTCVEYYLVEAKNKEKALDMFFNGLADFESMLQLLGGKDTKIIEYKKLKDLKTNPFTGECYQKKA